MQSVDEIVSECFQKYETGNVGFVDRITAAKLKSIVRLVFKVEKCQITLNQKTSKILFQFNCLFDTIKTHNVSILDHESLNAVYMTDNPPNRFVI